MLAGCLVQVLVLAGLIVFLRRTAMWTYFELGANDIALRALCAAQGTCLQKNVAQGSGRADEPCSHAALRTVALRAVDRATIAAVSSGLREQVYTLRGFGRASSLATLLAITIEMSWGLAGGSGLMALQAGLPARTALSAALFSVALGGTTLGLSVWGTRRLAHRAKALQDALRGLLEPTPTALQG